MLTDERTNAIFEEFIKKTSITGITLELHNYSHSALASYDAIQNVIHIDVSLLNKIKFNYHYNDLESSSFLAEDYLKIILAHEIGHAIDRKSLLISTHKETQWLLLLKNAQSDLTKRKLISKIISRYLKLETTAWENGKIFISEKLKPLYLEIYKQSITEGTQLKQNKLEDLLS